MSTPNEIFDAPPLANSTHLTSFQNMRDKYRSALCLSNTFFSNTNVLTASTSTLYPVSVKLRLTYLYKHVVVAITASSNLTAVRWRFCPPFSKEVPQLTSTNALCWSLYAGYTFIFVVHGALRYFKASFATEMWHPPVSGNFRAHSWLLPPVPA